MVKSQKCISGEPQKSYAYWFLKDEYIQAQLMTKVLLVYS